MLATVIVNTEMLATFIIITENNTKILAGTVEEKRNLTLNTIGSIWISK